MADYTEEEATAIVEWINEVFDITERLSNLRELVTGVHFLEIMRQVNEEYFNKAIEYGCSESEHRANINMLLDGLVLFYRKFKDREFDLRGCVDLDKLCEEKDIDTIWTLLELVVGAIFLCKHDDQKKHVDLIKAMSDVIKDIIKDVLLQFQNRFESDNEGGAEEAGPVYASVEEERDALLLETNDRKYELEELREKVATLSKDNEELRSRSAQEMEELRNTHDKTFKDMENELQAKVADLQDQLDGANEQVAQMRDTIRSEFQALGEKEAAKSKTRFERLEEKNSELIAQLEDFNQLKATNEQLRKIVHDVSADKKTLLERFEANQLASEQRLARILELEGKQKDQDFNKEQLGKCKLEMKELQLKVLSMTSTITLREDSIKSLDIELNECQTKCNTYENEIQTLKQELAESARDKTEVSAAYDSLEQVSSTSYIPPDVAEKIARLEHQIESLTKNKDSEASSSDQQVMEKLELEVLAREEKCVQLNLEIQKLGRELEKERTKKHEASEARIKELEEIISSKQSVSANNQALKEVVAKLSEEVKLEKATNEKLTSERAKLKAYTQKSLQSVQETYQTSFHTMKEQLKEAEHKYERLADQYKRHKSQSQREIQLMSSAVYELGMNITEQRLVRNLDRSTSASTQSKASQDNRKK